MGLQHPMAFILFIFPLHDRTGHSIVIEFIDGKAHIYNNPVHVCTNAPEFPHHISNLRNFVNLSNKMYSVVLSMGMS
ncbi:linear amide C-N hydrolase [Vibrio sp. PP-XX7]